MTPSVLIIGYGSDLRGDDALGQRAAEMLLERYGEVANVTVLQRASLTPELAHDVSLADVVVFVDCDADAEPAVITRHDTVPIDDASAAMVHFLDPPALLGWSKLLYGSEARGVMFTMGGVTFECADELSTPVESAMPELIDRVSAEVDAALGDREVVDA